MNSSEWKSFEERLSKWRMGVAQCRQRHYETARYFSKWNYILGTTIIIFSTLAGTFAFISLENQVQFEIKFMVGCISVLAAVLAAVQTFFHLSENAEKHKLTSTQFGTIRRKIEQILANPPAEKDVAKKLLEELDVQIEKLEIGSPLIPNHIEKRTVLTKS